MHPNNPKSIGLATAERSYLCSEDLVRVWMRYTPNDDTNPMMTSKNFPSPVLFRHQHRFFAVAPLPLEEVACAQPFPGRRNGWMGRPTLRGTTESLALLWI
jgi:hypothetical protein